MMAGGEIQLLPEPIVHRVLYFLSSKEAARTIVLSKSWGSAWLTRPNFDFDYDFEFDQVNFAMCDRLLNLAEKTFKRYEDSNLKIDSFRLCTRGLYCCYFNEIKNLIVRALNLGVTRLDIITYNGCFRLPNEVFASENLVELTLENCWINLTDVGYCSRLHSLTLKNMEMSYNKLSRVISSCPLIEKLSLRCIGNLNGGVVLHRLRSLELDNVKSDTEFLRGLASNFPSLKDLTLQIYINPNKEEGQEEDIEDMQISSPSLELLRLKTEAMKKDSWRRFKLDVPSIRKFTYEGKSIPSLSFRSTSRPGGWESHVVLSRNKSLTTSWFRRLSKLLTKLRRSRIHVSLSVYSRRNYDYKFGDLQGLPTRVIENLTIDFNYLPYLNCFVLLDGLFLTCSPKLITPRDNIDFVGQTLLQGLDVKSSSTPNQFMYGLKDLEEAKAAQIFDASGWRDVPLDAFQDKSKRFPALDSRVVRFQLKWQSYLDTSCV